jgi:hypothetical protein
MDALMPLMMIGFALLGAVASLTGHDSRDGFEPQDR